MSDFTIDLVYFFLVALGDLLLLAMAMFLTASFLYALITVARR